MDFEPQRVGGEYDWQLVGAMDESGLTFWAMGSRLRWKIVPDAVSERGIEIGVSPSVRVQASRGILGMPVVRKPGTRTHGGTRGELGGALPEASRARVLDLLPGAGTMTVFFFSYAWCCETNK